MTRPRLKMWIWLPLALGTVASSAQAKDRRQEPIICVGGGRVWTGDGADVRAIEGTPVPAGFRALFESKAACARYQLVVHSLIDWHLRFGSETSIAAALGYLEQDFVESVPKPERFAADLRRAWRAAVPDLRKAQEVKQPQGADYSAQHRYMETRRSIEQLNRLVRARDNYIFLTEQYLRAAEEFGSSALLNISERYLHALLESARFLQPLEDQAPAAGLLDFNLDMFKSEDFEMRAAVLRARLSRSPADIARARGLVQAAERPNYAQLAGAAFSGGDSFCDISEGASMAAELEAACRADDDMHERVVNY